MRQGIVIVALVVLAAVSGPGAAAAETLAPDGGADLGRHVASITPEHPLEDGQMFGECVATMARTGSCPHLP